MCASSTPSLEEGGRKAPEKPTEEGMDSGDNKVTEEVGASAASGSGASARCVVKVLHGGR